LVGQISPSLLMLENLEYLDLSSNDLEGSTGRIPEFLGSLKNLKFLNLSGIQFFGPAVLQQLVADWPHVVNKIPSLRPSPLSNCFLTSANQSLSHLNLTNLEVLDLSENHFNHPVACSPYEISDDI
ncbi:hypothetical protein BAE44_0024644, partial [Dichanthelium oligosanthes]